MATTSICNQRTEALATTAAFLELDRREYSSAVEHITAGVVANHSAGAESHAAGASCTVTFAFDLRQSDETKQFGPYPYAIAYDDYFYYGTGASGCSSPDVCVVTAVQVDPSANNTGKGYGQCTPPSRLKETGLNDAQRAEVCCTDASPVTGGPFCMAPSTTVELQSSPHRNAVPIAETSINAVERFIENHPKHGWKHIVRWLFPGAVDYISPLRISN
ncbi:unnamed protein product [Vitrella brassicaformis CCMP3155]|uniref:Uncharacterized protein n=1 Tax=Vitrella brassicaformis (strain CCMP3155) TaxID=1169540 RepID=A0A0G4EJH7_VITBC|nr:unnamed protein product [Vitrella brassicaformis CCMP3155]|eukprot:CEL96679.1 unnamed protein product [Vitrella brassicaformis CCMP3155]